MGVRFASAASARRWLSTLVPSISTLADVNAFREIRRSAFRSALARPASPVWTNVAFSVAGLSVLAPDVAAIRDRPFRQGMGAESNLGDPHDPSHPGHVSHWVVGGSPEKTPDALLVLGGDDLHALGKEAARQTADQTVVYHQEGHGLDGDVEHFGFRDGISTPGARGRISETQFLTRRYLDRSDERANRFARPGQPLVWPGQFVFGYPKQRDDDPVAPGAVSRGGPEWTVNGSFLVFRRLRQDVAAFRRFVDDEARRLAIGPQRLAALLVGRWPKGTALLRNPDGDDPDPMADRLTVNDFGFTADRLGRVCPGFSHIRKVNPRDLPTDKGGPDRTLTFAVLRRGIPFGPPYDDDPTAERGLLFVCYQTSIKDQFEVLNTDWMNRSSGPEANAGHDLLVGQGPGAARQRTASLGTTTITTLAEWVTPTGGGYFFSPSISALRGFSQ